MRKQQELFAIEYVKLHCKNATQAAKNAGYSQKTAYAQAHELLKKPEIQQKIGELKTKLAEELRQQMQFEASRAFDVLVDIMNNESAKDADRIKCAVDLLDRSGYMPEKKIEVSTHEDEKAKMDSILRQLGMINE